MGFPQTYIDKTKAARLVECLKRYRRSVPSTTGEAANPVHDEWSHGADAWRYMHTIADRMTNEDWGAALNYPDLRVA
jgi:phage terminase large subunit